MKSIKKITYNFKGFVALLVLSLLQTAVWAQDGAGADIDVKVTKESSNWYAQPWVWIVGGAVFLLLLVALMRGNNNKA
ncbi:MAG: hypothetical protein H0V14_11435 [Chitinophagaceae bacterium]|jgi:hypothetical protein|nr:hypothetical protein [Chitinophagaceae bacterium]